MRKPKQLPPEASAIDREAMNVLLAAMLLLTGFLWLIAYATGKLEVIVQAIRPYLPSWFPLVNLVAIPITCALARLRSVSFRIGFCFVLVFVAQWSLLGLSAQSYPIAKAAVMIFVLFEAFFLIPYWNRRILEKEQDVSVLGLSSGKGQH